MGDSVLNTAASIIALLASVCAVSSSQAHTGHVHARSANSPARTWTSVASEFQTDGSLFLQHPLANQQTPSMAKSFAAFAKTGAIRTRWDDRYFWVESSGLPAHQMMVGITAWQQQVPLPQNYVGNNAWRIPLHPMPAARPTLAKNRFLRGAIALAVNGVPIFNPLNNRGDDAYLFGELDQFGGHCGRADDYHYHIAPVHLVENIDKGLPIAYALDGYPIYGYNEPDGSPVKNLDALNGHKDSEGQYHYHATKTYPYLNGGFYGKVTERGGQVDPQPRAEPIRPAMSPLRGATISDFQETAANSYRLTYKRGGKTGSVSYSIANDGSVNFSYVDTAGNTTSESYSLPTRSGRRVQPPRPPRGARADVGAEEPPQRATTPRLIVSSSAFAASGDYPADFTCDGVGESPPVSWSEGPQGTECYALNLWHVPGPARPGPESNTRPEGVKSYWLLYNIPPDVTSLPRNANGIGVAGYNDKDRTDYDPMCSRGPGAKEYHITVYALSKIPDWPAAKVARADLLRTIGPITLAEGTLSFKYARSSRLRWLFMLAAAALIFVVACVARFLRRR